MTLEDLWNRFQQLVSMIQRDLPALKNGMNTVHASNQALRAEVAMLMKKVEELEKNGGVPPTVPDIVTIDPATGRAVTQQQLDADPKLRLRLRFSDGDAP